MQTITQVLCSDCVLGCKVKNPKMLTRTTNIPTMCRGVTYYVSLILPVLPFVLFF